MRRILPVVLLAANSLAAVAQQAPAPAPASQVVPAATLDAQQLCTREFGDQFKLDAKFAPLALDLDGDGQEDLVLVATAKNPLIGELDYHYRTVDPYDGYFGFGDPKITLQFSATNAGPARYVLVVHNWRAPKAKFVIINLPFDTISAGRIVVKKRRTLNSIHAIETGALTSDVYWDGKKYKWEPASFGSD